MPLPKIETIFHFLQTHNTKNAEKIKIRPTLLALNGNFFKKFKKNFENFFSQNLRQRKKKKKSTKYSQISYKILSLNSFFMKNKENA